MLNEEKEDIELQTPEQEPKTYADKLDRIFAETESKAKGKPTYNYVPEEKKKSSFMVIISVCAVILIAVLGVVFYFASNLKDNAVDEKESSSVEKVDLDSLAGLTEEQARTILEGKHLTMVVDGYESSMDVPEGQIISQNPEAGQVDIDTEVSVVVSKGPETAKIPNLINKKVKNARKQLEKLGFVVNVKKEYSEDVESGKVLEIDKEVGSNQLIGSLVTLTVSKGAKPEETTQSDVYSTVNRNKAIETEMTTVAVVEPTTKKITPLGRQAEYNDLSNSKASQIRNSLELYCYGDKDDTMTNLARYMSAKRLTDPNAAYESLTGDDSSNYRSKTATVHIYNDSSESIDDATESLMSQLGNTNGKYGIGISSFIGNEGYSINVTIVWS